MQKLIVSIHNFPDVKPVCQTIWISDVAPYIMGPHMDPNSLQRLSIVFKSCCSRAKRFSCGVIRVYMYIGNIVCSDTGVTDPHYAVHV